MNKITHWETQNGHKSLNEKKHLKLNAKFQNEVLNFTALLLEKRI